MTEAFNNFKVCITSTLETGRSAVKNNVHFKGGGCKLCLNTN